MIERAPFEQIERGSPGPSFQQTPTSMPDAPPPATARFRQMIVRERLSTIASRCKVERTPGSLMSMPMSNSFTSPSFDS